jgi:flavodoxin
MGEDIVYILYFSRSGTTKMLAKRVHEIFTALLPKHLEIKLVATHEIDTDTLRKGVGFIIGTPDYFSYPAGQIKIFFDEMYEIRNEMKDKPIFGFITHGGGGKALKPLMDLCTADKFKVITPFISIQKGKEISKKDEAQIEKNCKLMLKMLGKDENIQY